MKQNTINIASLIGSRICHDLISPIGAINNGLELMGMSGTQPSPEMDLISESVGNANARIRFFRIAFGAAGDQAMGREEIASILRDMTNGGRLSVAWGPLDPQPRNEVRLAFLALQCLELAMPYGGRVEISKDEKRWKLHGIADKFNVDEALWSVLATCVAPEHLQPSQVQFLLLPFVAQETGRRVTTQIGPQDLQLAF